MKKWMIFAAAILVVLGIGFAVKGASDKKQSTTPEGAAVPETTTNAPSEEAETANALREETETEDGADAFDQAGSLCHGWSAMPVYFYYAYGLGVRPVKPGFARTADAARRMDGCYGSVPTPEGMIHVEKKAK